MKRLVFLVSLAALVSACGSSSTSPTASTPAAAAPALQSVALTAVLTALAKAGDSTQAIATGTFSNGTTQVLTTSCTNWLSDNPSVLSISGSGLMTAQRSGSATVTTTCQGVAARGLVTLTLASTPAPATTFTLNGIVTDGTSHGILPNITVQITAGTNVGRSAQTDGTGNYTMTGLSAGTFTLSVAATSYQTTTQSLTLSANARVDLVLQRVAAAPAPTPTPTPTPGPIFSRSGVGDNVFDIPTTVSRIRITASTGSTCQNFVVKIAGRLIVNVILGTCSVADERTHDGTYLTSGGVAEVQISSGVSWTFTEVR